MSWTPAMDDQWQFDYIFVARYMIEGENTILKYDKKGNC